MQEPERSHSNSSKKEESLFRLGASRYPSKYSHTKRPGGNGSVTNSQMKPSREQNPVQTRGNPASNWGSHRSNIQPIGSHQMNGGFVNGNGYSGGRGAVSHGPNQMINGSHRSNQKKIQFGRPGQNNFESPSLKGKKMTDMNDSRFQTMAKQQTIARQQENRNLYGESGVTMKPNHSGHEMTPSGDRGMLTGSRVAYQNSNRVRNGIGVLSERRETPNQPGSSNVRSHLSGRNVQRTPTPQASRRHSPNRGHSRPRTGQRGRSDNKKFFNQLDVLTKTLFAGVGIIILLIGVRWIVTSNSLVPGNEQQFIETGLQSGLSKFPEQIEKEPEGVVELIKGIWGLDVNASEQDAVGSESEGLYADMKTEYDLQKEKEEDFYTKFYSVQNMGHGQGEQNYRKISEMYGVNPADDLPPDYLFVDCWGNVIDPEELKSIFQSLRQRALEQKRNQRVKQPEMKRDQKPATTVETSSSETTSQGADPGDDPMSFLDLNLGSICEEINRRRRNRGLEELDMNWRQKEGGQPNRGDSEQFEIEIDLEPSTQEEQKSNLMEMETRKETQSEEWIETEPGTDAGTQTGGGGQSDTSTQTGGDSGTQTNPDVGTQTDNQQAQTDTIVFETEEEQQETEITTSDPNVEETLENPENVETSTVVDPNIEIVDSDTEPGTEEEIETKWKGRTFIQKIRDDFGLLGNNIVNVHKQTKTLSLAGYNAVGRGLWSVGTSIQHVFSWTIQKICDFVNWILSFFNKFWRLVKSTPEKIKGLFVGSTGNAEENVTTDSKVGSEEGGSQNEAQEENQEVNHEEIDQESLVANEDEQKSEEFIQIETTQIKTGDEDFSQPQEESKRADQLDIRSGGIEEKQSEIFKSEDIQENQNSETQNGDFEKSKSTQNSEKIVNRETNEDKKPDDFVEQDDPTNKIVDSVTENIENQETGSETNEETASGWDRAEHQNLGEQEQQKDNDIETPTQDTPHPAETNVWENIDSSSEENLEILNELADEDTKSDLKDEEFHEIKPSLWQRVKDKAGQTKNSISNLGTSSKKKIFGLFAGLRNSLSNIWDWITDKFVRFWDWLLNLFKRFGCWLRSAGGSVKRVVLLEFLWKDPEADRKEGEVNEIIETIIGEMSNHPQTETETTTSKGQLSDSENLKDDGSKSPEQAEAETILDQHILEEFKPTEEEYKNSGLQFSVKEDLSMEYPTFSELMRNLKVYDPDGKLREWVLDGEKPQPVSGKNNHAAQADDGSPQDIELNFAQGEFENLENENKNLNQQGNLLIGSDQEAESPDGDYLDTQSSKRTPKIQDWDIPESEDILKILNYSIEMHKQNPEELQAYAKLAHSLGLNSLDPLQTQIKEYLKLHGQLNDLKAQTNEFDQNIQAARDALDQALENKNLSQDQYNQLEAEIEAMDAQREPLKIERDSLIGQLRELEEDFENRQAPEANKMKEDLGLMEKQLRELESHIEEENNRLDESRERLGENDEQNIDADRENLNELKDQHEDTQIQLTDAEQKLKHATKNDLFTQKRLTLLRRQLERLKNYRDIYILVRKIEAEHKISEQSLAALQSDTEKNTAIMRQFIQKMEELGADEDGFEIDDEVLEDLKHSHDHTSPGVFWEAFVLIRESLEKILETSNAWDLNDYDGKIFKLKKRIKEVEELYRDYKIDLEVAENRHGELSVTQSALKSKVERLSENLYTAEERLQVIQEETSGTRAKLEGFKLQRDRLLQNMEKTGNSREQLLSHLKRKVKDLKIQIHGASKKIREINKFIKSKRKERRSVEDQVVQLHDHIQENRDTLDVVKNQRKSKNSQLRRGLGIAKRMKDAIRGQLSGLLVLF